jgi:hypothetical protein
MAGGKRRIDKVLDDEFVTNLSALPLEDLRARRAEAAQEETDLSYLRRLLQGRLDILRAQESGSSAAAPEPTDQPEDDAALVSRLTQILAEGGNRSPAAGLGRHQTQEPSRVGETRRVDEGIAGDFDDPAGMSPAELTAAHERLEASEHRVSEARKRVQGVIDVLGAEIARRYRDGDADVSSLLAG